MGKGGALSDGVVKKIILSYTYVAIWIFLSFTVIVYNKYILDKKLYNWPFPISLTMIHMTFCSSSLSPPSAFSSSWSPPPSVAASTSPPSYRSALSLSLPMAIELRIHLPLSLLHPNAKSPNARRCILLTSKGINLNPITSLYYVAPSCLAFLSIPWIFVEYPLLKQQSTGFHFDFVIFGTNSLCAFALNLAVFLLVGKTSALTMNVAGVVKDWLLIAFSWSVIKDTVTPLNLFGYGLAFLGVGYYNHSKLQALKAKEAQRRLSRRMRSRASCWRRGKEMEWGRREMHKLNLESI
ncbi:hypothetical protein DH2020_025555 [Rehmannia glutinosa]|uniref:Sugar phosphate transporter domain-containing protein n=1 Tax=Rehmannia glutinosa TaxID=99300 RepID=A0ABR0W1T1_REHGL